MSFGLSDKLTFGKYKGWVVSDVILQDTGWCCWIRDQKRERGQPRMFDSEVNKVLDEAIRDDRKLRAKFKIWHQSEHDLEREIKEAAEARRAIESREAKALDARQAAYADSWGAW